MRGGEERQPSAVAPSFVLIMAVQLLAGDTRAEQQTVEPLLEVQTERSSHLGRLVATFSVKIRKVKVKKKSFMYNGRTLK